MFERFTDRSRQVVVLSQEAARLLGHNYIGTEHLLLGLLSPSLPASPEYPNIATEALISFDLGYSKVLAVVDEIIGRNEHKPVGHIPFTPRFKKVLDLSLREALSLQHNYIGIEHLLLGLIREREGVGVQVLVKLGVDPSSVREKVKELLGVPGSQAIPAKSQSSSVSLAQNDAGELVLVISGYTPEFRVLLTKAVELAAKNGEPIGTEHLVSVLADKPAELADG